MTARDPAAARDAFLRSMRGRADGMRDMLRNVERRIRAVRKRMLGQSTQRASMHAIYAQMAALPAAQLITPRVLIVAEASIPHD